MLLCYKCRKGKEIVDCDMDNHWNSILYVQTLRRPIKKGESTVEKKIPKQAKRYIGEIPSGYILGLPKETGRVITLRLEKLPNFGGCISIGNIGSGK